MYTVTAYERVDSGEDFNHYVEIERVMFETELDAMDWADDSGFLDHHDYSISIEDPNGTMTHL